MLLPLAHAGHWVIWILYAIPVIVVVGSIVISMRRERAESAAPEDPASGAEDLPDAG